MVAQKTQMGLLRQAIKDNPHAVIGLLNQYAHGSDHLIFANDTEEGLLKKAGGSGTMNTIGVRQYSGQGPHGGGTGGTAGGGDGGGGGVGGGGGRGSTGTTAGGQSSPEGGFGGGERGSPAGAGSMGPAGGGPSMSSSALRDMSPQTSPNVSIGSVTHNVNPNGAPGVGGPGETPGTTNDPTSIGGMLSQALHNIMNPTPAVRGLGIAMSALPNPIGIAATTAIGLGTAMGTKDAATIAGVRNGTISGTISKDANGQDVAHVGGANYGGTATGTRGGTGTASGGMGSGPDNGANINNQMAQNALDASTGVPGNIPTSIPSLGLLGQQQAPTQQWTLPGYGFSTPGYGYLSFSGQK